MAALLIILPRTITGHMVDPGVAVTAEAAEGVPPLGLLELLVVTEPAVVAGSDMVGVGMEVAAVGVITLTRLTYGDGTVGAELSLAVVGAAVGVSLRWPLVLSQMVGGQG